MILSAHQPQYLPWLGYFDKIDKSDVFVFLDNVQYKHREYQNRNRICAKPGCLWLTVPVATKGLGRQLIKEVKIDNRTGWQRSHWESLKRCYNRAPFFKKYYGFFEKVYAGKWERLIGLNIHITEYLLKELKIKTPLKYESEIKTSSRGTERLIEICRKLKADTYLSGIGGKDYLEEDKFAEAGIELKYQKFIYPQYNQVYTTKDMPFLPNVSAIDLLFNCGEKSINILRGDKI